MGEGRRALDIEPDFQLLVSILRVPFILSKQGKVPLTFFVAFQMAIIVDVHHALERFVPRAGLLAVDWRSQRQRLNDLVRQHIYRAIFFSGKAQLTNK